jgi:FAD/FMN-containing dehydrogenase
MRARRMREASSSALSTTIINESRDRPAPPPLTPHRQFTSWGRVVRARHDIATPAFADELQSLLDNTAGTSVLAVGAGHSYGVTCLNSNHCLIDMTRLDRILAFDPERGVVRAEAGLAIDDLLRVTVPKGWFLTTTPGTRFVTLGGAVAHDVHGKNHHQAGSFGCSVTKLELLRSDGSGGELLAVDGDDLFRATIGGMGLTGIISSVELKLAPIRSAFVDVERIAFANTKEFFEIAAESTERYEHTVAWIDCATTRAHVGRGIFERGRWSEDGDLKPHDSGRGWGLPLEAPSFTLNRLTVGLFNALYRRIQKSRKARQRVHYAGFFYPLDVVRHWNRLYGTRGLYQYQCVIPPATAEPAVEELLRQMVRSGERSYFAVLKTFGSLPSPGLISFPREGATLVLDFPNRESKTLELLARFDAVVREAGGRLYAAKDGRMPAEMFRAGYPEWSSFARHVDPRFMSDFWARARG